MGKDITLRVRSWQDLADYFPGVQPLADLEHNGGIEYRSYQVLATSAVVLSGFRCVVRAATGGGKTLITAGICGAMLPSRSLVLIHGRELVAQTYKSLCNYLGRDVVGVIDSDTYAPKKVTVASIDAFGFYLGNVPVSKELGVPIMDPNVFQQNKLKYMEFLKNSVDMLVFDEVHHGSADTWQKIGEQCSAYYRVGLSGTPLKHDKLSDMQMMSLVGPVVFDLSAPWLQDKGYLAPAKLQVRRMDFTSPKARRYNWNDARKFLIVKNQDRTVNIAADIADAIQDPETRLLVLTGNSVELAQSLEEEVSALTRGLKYQLGFSPFVMVNGKSATRKVTKAFNDLRKGNVRCVITTKLADEGIDVPDINLLYLVGGGKAYVSTVQRIGRGLRVKADNRPLVVVDYFVVGNKYTEKHDRKRLKTYEDENFFSEITVDDVQLR